MGENIFVFTAFSAGLLSFFSPCILPVLPVYLTTLLGESYNKNVKDNSKIFGNISLRPILSTLLFICGLSIVFVSLGFGASFFGELFRSRAVSIVIGIVVILLGIHQMELINISVLNKQKSLDVSDANRKGGYLGSFLLGLGFSLGWSPCIGPVLSSILAISVSTSSVSGGFLMAAYSLGLATPFIIISIFSNMFIRNFKALKKNMKYAKKIGGILIILMGILLITGGLQSITAFFLKISN